MKKRNIICYLGFLALLLAACGRFSREPKTVILISFDGFRYDYADSVNTPALHSLEREGVRAAGLKSVFPTKTFPNHYSIATGLYAENHGIVLNRFYDPEREAWYRIGDTASVWDGSWYGGEPLWVTAKKNGQISASYFWVGSEADIKGYHPDYYYIYDHHRPHAALIRQTVKWLSLPEEKRPRLILLYFHDTDDFGHGFGTLSPENRNAIKTLDGVLGEIRAKIDSLEMEETVDLILLSDHGMRDIDRSHILSFPDELKRDDIKISNSRTLINVYTDNPGRRDSLYNSLTQTAGHFSVYKREDIPERYHYRDNRRIGELVLLAETGWLFGGRNGKGIRWNGKFHGAHGFDNDDPQMRGIFFAVGPDFKKGYRAPLLNNIDVYPLIARLLNWQNVPPVDGKFENIKEVLR